MVYASIHIHEDTNIEAKHSADFHWVSIDNATIHFDGPEELARLMSTLADIQQVMYQEHEKAA